MAKKGQQVQLQTELNTEAEWDAFVDKPVLTVVDIYSDWAGPCAAMQANLKKLKFDYGDFLQLAVAKSDTISYLERFRGSCEPTWMFVVEGQMVNLAFGADSPRLTAMIINELRKEEEIREGRREREGVAVTEMAPEEQARYDAIKAIEDEKRRLEIERAIQQLKERRLAVAHTVIENLPISGVILIWPHAVPNVKATLEEYWEASGLGLQSQERHCITEEMLEEMLYFSEQTFTDLDIENLFDGTAVAYHVKSRDSETLGPEAIDDAVLEFIYGESKQPPGSPDSPAEKLLGHVVVPKEVPPPPSVMTLGGNEESLGAVPSMPSMVLTQSQATVKSERSQVSMRSGDRSRVAMESTADLDQDESRSKSKISKSKMSKAVVISEVFVKEEVEEEEEEETVDVTGLWVPPNALTRATVLKRLFPKLYEPFAIPEPVPTPPHIAIAFEAYRRKELIPLMELYHDDIMRVGFFTNDSPGKGQIVAKSLAKFDKLVATRPLEGEKLVLQLSKKRSEPWCVFAQQSPTFMSNTVEDGEEHCKLFFPEDYDEEAAEEQAEKKKKKDEKVEEAREPSPAPEAEAEEEQERGEEGETEEPPPE